MAQETTKSQLGLQVESATERRSYIPGRMQPRHIDSCDWIPREHVLNWDAATSDEQRWADWQRVLADAVPQRGIRQVLQRTPDGRLTPTGIPGSTIVYLDTIAYPTLHRAIELHQYDPATEGKLLGDVTTAWIFIHTPDQHPWSVLYCWLRVETDDGGPPITTVFHVVFDLSDLNTLPAIRLMLAERQVTISDSPLPAETDPVTFRRLSATSPGAWQGITMEVTSPIDVGDVAMMDMIEKVVAPVPPIAGVTIREMLNEMAPFVKFQPRSAPRRTLKSGGPNGSMGSILFGWDDSFDATTHELYPPERPLRVSINTDSEMLFSTNEQVERGWKAANLTAFDAAPTYQPPVVWMFTLIYPQTMTALESLEAIFTARARPTDKDVPMTYWISLLLLASVIDLPEPERLQHVESLAMTDAGTLTLLVGLIRRYERVHHRPAQEVYGGPAVKFSIESAAGVLESPELAKHKADMAAFFAGGPPTRITAFLLRLVNGFWGDMMPEVYTLLWRLRSTVTDDPTEEDRLSIGLRALTHIPLIGLWRFPPATSHEDNRPGIDVSTVGLWAWQQKLVFHAPDAPPVRDAELAWLLPSGLFGDVWRAFSDAHTGELLGLSTADRLFQDQVRALCAEQLADYSAWQLKTGRPLIGRFAPLLPSDAEGRVSADYPHLRTWGIRALHILARSDNSLLIRMVPSNGKGGPVLWWTPQPQPPDHWFLLLTTGLAWEVQAIVCAFRLDMMREGADRVLIRAVSAPAVPSTKPSRGRRAAPAVLNAPHRPTVQIRLAPAGKGSLPEHHGAMPPVIEGAYGGAEHQEEVARRARTVQGVKYHLVHFRTPLPSGQLRKASDRQREAWRKLPLEPEERIARYGLVDLPPSGITVRGLRLDEAGNLIVGYERGGDADASAALETAPRPVRCQSLLATSLLHRVTRDAIERAIDDNSVRP